MHESSQGQQLVIGVLGGMGPAATVDFMQRVLAATPVEREQDHIRLLVDQNPAVPDRHQAMRNNPQQVGDMLAAMAIGLERAGADALVMPCNTAHAWCNDIRSAVSIPLIDMIELVVDSLSAAQCRHAGIMAARGCLEAGLYQRALAAQGLEAVTWEADELEQFMAAVYRIKAGEHGAVLSDTMARLAHALQARGADVLVAACTEIPLVLDAPAVALPVVSSTDLLVSKTLEMARHGHRED